MSHIILTKSVHTNNKLKHQKTLKVQIKSILALKQRSNGKKPKTKTTKFWFKLHTEHKITRKHTNQHNMTPIIPPHNAKHKNPPSKKIPFIKILKLQKITHTNLTQAQPKGLAQNKRKIKKQNKNN